MYPILFDFFLPFNLPLIGNHIVIHTFGAFAALGFITAYLLSIYRAQKYSIDKEQFSDIFFYSAIAGIIGARLNYVIVNISEFSDSLIDVFKIYNGGLVFYGGAIAGILTGVIYCKLKKINIFAALDCIAPAFALGHLFGRLGCFSFGCCYGKVCSAASSFGLRFPFGSPAYLKHRELNIIDSAAYFSASVYSTQLMEALFLLILALFLFLYEKKIKKINGELFVLYIMFYFVFRFIIEIYREPDQTFVFRNALTFSQMASIAIFIGALIFIFKLRQARD